MMSIPIHSIAVLAFSAVIAGCSSSGNSSPDGRIDSGLRPVANLITLEPDGSVPDQNFSSSGTRGNGSIINEVNGRLSGFAYQYGRVEGTNRFLGVAGIVPTTDPGPLPTTATATYTGRYQLAYASQSRVEGRDGQITLKADFEDGELTGSAGLLEIEGTITGQIVGGTASYRDVEAEMFGLIGSERAVTAFAGDNDRAMLVGGINAEAND